MLIVKAICSDLHACGHVRLEIMAREINANLANMQVDVKNCIVMSDFPKANIMVFQRAHAPEIFAKMMMAKKLGIKTIYETDDDMLHMPEGFQKPYDFYKQPQVRQQMVDFMENADIITTSTVELANRLTLIVPKKPIFVAENALDVKEWNDAYAKRQAKKKAGVTIGWMASGSHTIDIPLVKEALELLLEQNPLVSVHFIGWIGFENIGLEKYKDRIIVENWVPIDVLPYAMMNFDIGICPLEDNPFNRCKSNLKFLQHSALGIPSICSPLPPYEGTIDNGVDGLFATTPADWLACLSELVENEKLRVEMGAKARLKLLEKYDMSKNYLQWANIFERVMKM